jgi:hypothetical protein
MSVSILRLCSAALPLLAAPYLHAQDASSASREAYHTRATGRPSEKQP